MEIENRNLKEKHNVPAEPHREGIIVEMEIKKASKVFQDNQPKITSFFSKKNMEIESFEPVNKVNPSYKIPIRGP